jgi:hypothetical protein
MRIVIHKDGNGDCAVGPGYQQRVADVTQEQYDQIDYLYHKQQHLLTLLEILYKEAVV